MGEQSPKDQGHSSADALAPDSYTAQRLRHATPEHLHLTSRRCFIGPVPEGWLKSHRKQWYRHYLHINYSSRAPSFSATDQISHLRRISGLEGPSVSATHGHSFPQPDDAEDEERNGASSQDGDDDGDEATFETPPAVPVARILDSEHDSELPRINTEAGAHLDAPKSPVNRQSDVSEGPESQSANLTPSSSKLPPNESERTSTSANGGAAADSANSMSSLLQHKKDRSSTGQKANRKSILTKVTPKYKTNNDEGTTEEAIPALENPVPTGLVRFNVPLDDVHDERERRVKLAKLNRRRSLRRRQAGRNDEGEIIKAEKMLVRVDSTRQQLSNDFDENESSKSDTRTIEKWREYIVVCRAASDEGAEYVLQLYKSRVVPAFQSTGRKKQTQHEILLRRKVTGLNLFSPLDKTLVIWNPTKQGTTIFIMQPRSSTSSVEWFTFLNTSLGWHRPREVQVHVPDLNLILKLEDPFERLEAQRIVAQSADAETEDQALLQTVIEEQAVAGNIVRRSMQMLSGASEWDEILKVWSREEKMGLAWKRYDRLEWVHGTNEQKMYGTFAMQKTHDLELRPKCHYPTRVDPDKDARRTLGSTASLNAASAPSMASSSAEPTPQEETFPSVRTTDADSMLIEPPPVEGFLIRLTSQRGRDQRFGRMFYKRLYFSTHNQFLTFCRPAKAIPPPPPKLAMTPDSQIPSSQEIADKMPLIFGISPFALDGEGQLRWLRSRQVADVVKHDRDAYDEAERQVNSLLRADGYIDLCDVQEVRSGVRGTMKADENIEDGSQVNFHEHVQDTHQEDGAVEELDLNRCFELVMVNGLIVRLEAYNADATREWISRLRGLIRYWTVRSAADLDLLKSVRQANLDKLHIDEESESYLGQFGQKWEVSQSIASAQLYHMCSVASCRAISMAGHLFRKPRRHSTFQRCSVILCHGQLLIFQSSLRKQTGEQLPHAHHERQVAIDLRDCYVYSGLLSEGDLLYQNQTFDSNHPGRHALPRVYRDDGWTSTDEDTALCFVLWHGRKGALFHTSAEDVLNPGGRVDGQKRRLKAVTRLGVPGRAMVFKTRSRAERDHWVMSLGIEIERLQQVEDIRIVEK